MKPLTEAEVSVERRLTEAMREADRAFESVGGSTRHFVRDCLLPALEASHLAIVDGYVPYHLKSAERDVRSLADKLDAAEKRIAELEREHLSAMKAAVDCIAVRNPACGCCERAATCVGAYEGSLIDFACDECCGHGNEDGWCRPLPRGAGPAAVAKAREALSKTFDAFMVHGEKGHPRPEIQVLVREALAALGEE